MAEPTAPDVPTLTAILQKLTERASGGLTEEQLTRALQAGAEANAAQSAASMRQVLHPQNAQHPGKSAFSYPEGDVARPKPVLRPNADGLPGVCFFCGAKEDPSQLTPHQIDLYNRFDRTRTTRDGRWKAEVATNGVDLSVTVPCKSIDDRMDLPSLDLILTELLDGASAVDPISLAERVATLEAQLAKR
ncbi:MAG TPA: hypothetical protein VE200_08675 [Xanthobacteraceae bacterium]|nr:hypothetical protein [Xanthobacteraceae bacterium]